MRGLLAGVLWLIAGIAQAQDLPDRFSVTGVAADDVLNIRQGPSADTPIIGELAPSQSGVEVLRLNEGGKWGLVGVPEGNGWVAMRFMTRETEAFPYVLPRPMRCFGTEPFWALTMDLTGDTFSTPEGDTAFTLTEEGETRRAMLARFEDGDSNSQTLLIERGLCGDGMSDRDYGFAARLFLRDPGGNRFLTGCCTLDMR